MIFQKKKNNISNNGIKWANKETCIRAYTP